MTRLVLKLLFKASLPLALLIGTMSYGVYLRGGDPAAILGSVGGGIKQRLAGLIGGATDDARRGVAHAGSVLGRDGESGYTTVFTWTDAGGVTHFASSAPDGVVTRTIQVDPDVNVLAPLVRPVDEAAGSPRLAGAAAPGDARLAPASQDDEPMPGVAGLLQASDRQTADPREAQRLLRMLQGGGSTR